MAAVPCIGLVLLTRPSVKGPSDVASCRSEIQAVKWFKLADEENNAYEDHWTQQNHGLPVWGVSEAFSALAPWLKELQRLLVSLVLFQRAPDPNFAKCGTARRPAILYKQPTSCYRAANINLSSSFHAVSICTCIQGFLAELIHYHLDMLLLGFVSIVASPRAMYFNQ